MVALPGTYGEALSVSRSVSLVAGAPGTNCDPAAPGTAEVVVDPPVGQRALNVSGSGVVFDATGVSFVDGAVADEGGLVRVASGAQALLAHGRIETGRADRAACVLVDGATLALEHMIVLDCADPDPLLSTEAIWVRGGAEEPSKLDATHTAIEGPAAGHGVLVFSGSVFPIVDLEPASAAFVDTTIHDAGGAGLIVAGTDASAVVGGATVIERCGGSGVRVQDHAELIVEGSAEIRDNLGFPFSSARRGGGMFADSQASVTVRDDVRIGDNVADLGGGIYVESARIELSGSVRVDGNFATWDGGGLRVRGADLAVGDAVVIEGNTAMEEGGGIYIDNGDLEVFGDARIRDNTADLGGGIRARTPLLLVPPGPPELPPGLGGETGAGGPPGAPPGGPPSGAIPAIAIPMPNPPAPSFRRQVRLLDRVQVVDNVATRHGGGLYAEDCDVLVGGSSVFSVDTNVVVVEGNAAVEDGGGLYLDGGTALANDGARLVANEATRGGAVFAAGAAFTATGGATLSENHAGSDGGGVYQDGGALTLQGCAHVDANLADGDGGGVFAVGAEVLVDSEDAILTVRSNEAVNGGGMYLDGCTSLVRSFEAAPEAMAWIAGNLAAGDGGGIRVRGGTLDLEYDVLIGAEILPPNDVVPGQGNEAAGAGGGVYADQGAVVTANGHMWTLKGTDTCDENSDIGIAEACPVDQLAFLGFPVVRGNLAHTAGGAGFAGGGVALDGATLFARSTVISHNDGAPLGAGAGGGLALANGATALLSDTTIHLNHADVGGGVWVAGGSTVTTDTWTDALAPEPIGDTCATRAPTEVPWEKETDRYCTEISFNTARFGAGVDVSASTVSLENVGMVVNDATTDRAAVNLVDGAHLDLVGSLVGHHDAFNKAVILAFDSTLSLRGSTFSQRLQVLVAGTSRAEVNGSIFWDDALSGADMLAFVNAASGAGSCNMGQGVDALDGATNDEGVDPLFVRANGTDFWLDPASPAINRCAADLSSRYDLMGARRDILSAVDMGAFEVVP